MRQTGQTKKVPFNKGFYGGFKDSASTLLANNYIPLGYYFGQDVVIDDAGYLRARPTIGYFVTSAVAATSPLAVFKLAGSYYAVSTGGDIYRCTSTTTPTWAAVTSSPDFTSKVNVDFITNTGSTTPLALVSTSTGTQNIVTVTGGTATVATGNAKGIASQDEGRVFCVNSNLVYYSTRFNQVTGYNDTAGNEWFSIPEICDEIIALKNVAGSLYLIQSSQNTDRIYVWKKVQTYSDALELIDFTSFTQVLGVDDACIKNGIDGVGVIGGNICFWAHGSGLNIVSESGTRVVSEAIAAHNPLGLNYDCIVATDQRSKKIFCKETTSTTTHVYDMVTNTWSNWNINVACKGYGQAGGMFGLVSNWAPAYVSTYATSSSDTSVTPVVYTPCLDFDEPQKEKFLTEIHCAHRGVTEIKVYSRLTPADSFAQMGDTITSPERVTRLAGDHRFGEIYLKITGNSTMLIKELELKYDIGDTIYE